MGSRIRPSLRTLPLALSLQTLILSIRPSIPNGLRYFADMPSSLLTMTLSTRATNMSSMAYRGRETFSPSRRSFLTGHNTPTPTLHQAWMAFSLLSLSTYLFLLGEEDGCFYAHALALVNGRHLFTTSLVLPSERRINWTPLLIQALQSPLDTAFFPYILRSTA